MAKESIRRYSARKTVTAVRQVAAYRQRYGPICERISGGCRNILGEVFSLPSSEIVRQKLHKADVPFGGSKT